MVLVLVQPLVAIICEKLVLSKCCVDKAIDKGRCQIHTSRVHLGATTSKPCNTQCRNNAKCPIANCNKLYIYCSLAAVDSKSQIPAAILILYLHFEMLYTDSKYMSIPNLTQCLQ